ncbi:30S ribosomal protein S17 [Candidatus Woesebacteria bacterium]|nr:30S ribosomal protein S17 [Candidatus Woesebacteria bacterium]
MKTLIGTIAGLHTAKTAKVTVERQWQHPLYKKSVKRTKAYACHFEDLKLEVGDRVEITETRPLSRTKRFRVSRKLGEAV